MKTEAEVFFTETKPFIETLSERVNPQFVLNMTWNYPHLEKLLNRRDMNMTIAEPRSQGPAIVTGSGPSLTACMPYLNEARETHGAKIFCTASQVWSLYFSGVTPDYVTQHDPWARGCPICGDLELSHVYFTDDGECKCFNGHTLEGEHREQVIRGTNVHRWAPEIGCKVLAHPGVQLEQLMWPDFVERGEFYFNNFNPNIGPYQVRDIIRGNEFQKAGSEYLRTEGGVIKALMAGQDPEKETERLENAWTTLIDAFVRAPGQHEPQDSPMWNAVSVYGEGNPKIKYPIRIAAPYAPSTTFQNAVMAFMKGHNPIYFVGYDLCHWKNMSYHRKIWYDETVLEMRPGKPAGEEDRTALNGFRTDYVQVGEKYALAGYVSKEFAGYYALPGLQIVEVIAEGTPGNLEFYPRIDIDRFAKGETRDVSQEVTAKKINAIVKERKTQEAWK